VFLACGFTKDDDDTITFEYSNTELLKFAVSIINTALPRFPAADAVDPPAYIPFLRRYSSLKPPPAPVLKAQESTRTVEANAARRAEVQVDPMARGLEILSTIKAKLLMTPEEAAAARAEEAEQRRILEEQARKEQQKADEEAARLKALEIRRIEDEKRLEQMQKDYEAALKMQRAEQEAQQKRREEARQRREEEERKMMLKARSEFKVGDEVTVYGLTQSTSLNGLNGKVSGIMNQEFRWPVEVCLKDGTKRICNFRSQNLKPKVYSMTDKQMQTMGRLMEMGFTSEQARSSSIKADGDMQRALQYACGERT